MESAQNLSEFVKFLVTCTLHTQAKCLYTAPMHAYFVIAIGVYMCVILVYTYSYKSEKHLFV